MMSGAGMRVLTCRTSARALELQIACFLCYDCDMLIIYTSQAYRVRNPVAQFAQTLLLVI